MPLTLFYAKLLQHKLLNIHIAKGKKAAFPVIVISLLQRLKKLRYPLGETDQYKDRSKDILNSILKEELPDSDSQVERTMSRRDFVIEIKVL